MSAIKKLTPRPAREPKEVWIVPGVRHAEAYGADAGRYVERVASFFGHALR
jgi:fermentation-respiration switch protein FrsA (DUF1100 family)